MTKQQIWSKILDGDIPGWTTMAMKAMDEYAKQEAILFKEWEDSSLEGKEWHKYDGHDTWINTYTMEVISTEQLYELFLKDKR